MKVLLAQMLSSSHDLFDLLHKLFECVCTDWLWRAKKQTKYHLISFYCRMIYSIQSPFTLTEIEGQHIFQRLRVRSIRTTASRHLYSFFP